MLITKTNPVGVDKNIQDLQTYLHDAIISLFGLADSSYRCYGRCYRNKTEDGFIAENYEGGNEYKEAYWDDSLSLLSFFGIGDSQEHNESETIDVHLVFFADINKVLPAITHRADEEIRNKITGLLISPSYGFTFQNIELYLDNVLREYPGSRRDERLKYVDMHPTHCFRLNFELNYILNNNCTPFKT